jgi:hypothetical protein
VTLPPYVAASVRPAAARRDAVPTSDGADVRAAPGVAELDPL